MSETGTVTIFFDHERPRFLSGNDHDPIVRDWPAIPQVGDYLSFDIGDERPVEGIVRSVHWEDAGLKQPNIRVVFS